MKYKIIFSIAFFSFLMLRCTKLDETLRGDLTFPQAQEITDVGALLKSSYNGLRTFQSNDDIWSLQTLTTDEGIPPTRAGDWDDNGAWRALYSHIWTGENVHVQSSFNNLLGVVFSTTNLLNFNPTPQQAAEARFIRAFVMFTVLDNWNQVPFRQPGENLLNPPQVLKGTEALDFIIAELNEILNDLPDNVPAYTANKNAARTLLMKCFLNKGTFANRESPSFDAADMGQVITLADQIISSGEYDLSDNFFDNFAPNNNVISKELIFTELNVADVEGGNVRFQVHAPGHYNENPGGWNGFTTLSDFYDKFEASDTRRGGSYPGITDKTGWPVGFRIGQQYDQNGVPRKDRLGNPLAFTREVKLIESGANLEVTGIRVGKYLPDYKSDYSSDRDQAGNDYVLLRYADVLLMKAEALLRTAKDADALTVVNDLRAKRGASALESLDLDKMLDERGREMYWEGWRREDLIRFGKYLDPVQERPSASDPTYLLFPIPGSALAVNPNLEQNPGYSN